MKRRFLLVLITSVGLLGWDAGLLSAEPGFAPEPPPPPPPHSSSGRADRGHRSRHGDPEFPAHRFRRELRELGRRMRENRSLIRELEESLGEESPGAASEEIRVRLGAAYEERALLHWELARRKVEITNKGVENARLRYERALDEAAAMREWLKTYYPQILEANPDDFFLGDDSASPSN